MALEKAPGTGLCAPKVIKFMCDDCCLDLHELYQDFSAHKMSPCYETA